MIATREQIEDFYRFASTQLNDGTARLTMDEIYQVWRARRPTPTELQDSVAAVNEAYAAFRAGERGEPARAALRDTCRELGLVMDE